MSFDKETRNLLAKTVAACRRRLTEDVTDQLRGTFGLHPDGTVLPLEKLTHLTEEQAAAARRLRELLDHYAAGAAGTPSARRKAAYERLVLEISFTALNRLAALRLCEERGLVVECVRKGTASDGFRLFERVSGGALGTRYETYRVFLECLFDELALDLGVLFDRFTPQSAVFPGQRCLEEVLDELNKPDLAHLWTEDETIGWIYQYFNPPEERKAMREASQAPRNSRELAVRNQFFTPRYVVEFLTDNTLGRIWYEMRKGDTRLKEECRYLVRRPNEVFLEAGEKAPSQDDASGDLSQEELLKQPVYIEHRPKKDPRDLRVLDPACGSGHFLLYAFDLLETIYEEAWEDPESPASEATGRTLREEFETLDELRRNVPKLIIEHNLHGIDIDPRAVQIAALALWLRAQKTWKRLGLKPAERPRVTKSNIVTAEPMPGEEDLRREFIEALRPKVLGQLVEVVFDKMKLAGEAGSLLKIEEEIRDAVAEAKKQWLEGPKPEQAVLFPELVEPKPEQRTLFDVKEITDEEFWNQAEERILTALKEYAERAENGRVLRRLFAEDAARGFAFVDLCRKRYDVVLMNPPFGNATDNTLDHHSRYYPTWNGNLLCAFLARAWGLLQEGGAVGCIYDRTANVKSTYEDCRRELLVCDDRLVAMADLGWGVLDANVETAAQILSQKWRRSAHFFDVRSDPPENKENALQQYIHSIRTPIIERGSAFRSFPNASLAYDMPSGIRRAFARFPALRNAGAYAIVGHQLKSDWHMGCWWEIPPQELDQGGKYRRLYNGGAFCCYYMPLVEIALWGDSGELVRYHKSVYLRNSAYQFRPAVGYGKRGEFVDAHIVPKGFIFTNEGQAVLVNDGDDKARLFFLGLMNSRFFTATINLYCGQHKQSGYVNQFPVARVGGEAEQRAIGTEALRIALKKREIDSRNEASPIFLGLPQTERSLALEVLRDSQQSFENLEELVYQLYGFSEEERKEIGALAVQRPNDSVPFFGAEPISKVRESDVSSSLLSYLVGVLVGRWDVRIALDPSLAPKLPDPFDPLPVCPPGMLVGPDGLPAKPGGIVSEEWLRARPDANSLPPDGAVSKPTIPDSEYPLRINWDGILVDDPGFNGDRPHRDDIVRRVREVLDLLWGDRAQEIEQEACEILGVRDLRDYFRKPSGFFQDHLKRYSKSRRKAPIYWPLSTASGSYTIWLYYHRLTDQTLYAAVNKYLEPKIADTERALDRLEEELADASGREATRLRDRLNEGRTFLGELQDLREELLRVAGLPYKPDLNDGVIINAAPLHRLFRLRSWAKETEKVWKKLEKGDYDWARMAYTIWPDRVREACRHDRSIAIAHGLEDICEVEPPAPKKKGGRGRRRKEAAR